MAAAMAMAGQLATAVTDTVTDTTAKVSNAFDGLAAGSNGQKAAKLASQTAARLDGVAAGQAAASAADRTGSWVSQLLDGALSGDGKLVGASDSMNTGQSGTGASSTAGQGQGGSAVQNQASSLGQGQNTSAAQPASRPRLNMSAMPTARPASDDQFTAADVSPAQLLQNGVPGAVASSLKSAIQQQSQQQGQRQSARRTGSSAAASPAGLSGAALPGPGVDKLFSGIVDLVSGVVNTVGGQAAGQQAHATLTQMSDQVESALAVGAALNNNTGSSGVGGSGGRQAAVTGSMPARDAGPTMTPRPGGYSQPGSGAVTEPASRITGCASGGSGCADNITGAVSRFVESLSG
ncbi:MAG: hypothetical protein ACRD0H_06110, partial [Actinomycetes bacterium]